jgi:group I intron endonuclease
MNTRIIYKLTSPSGGIYIGQTNDFIHRMSCHKYNSISENKIYITPLYNAIRKYGWDNFSKEILFDKVAEELIDDLESYLIFNYRTTKHKVYNVESGGHKNKNISEETKKKISKKNKNKKHSLESRKKISENKKGKMLSKEHKEKISKSMKGKKFSEKHRLNLSKNNAKAMKGKFGKFNPTSKKVLQYDLNMNFIKKWDSLMDIERELKIADSNISRVCQGKRNHSGGFIWRYK